MADLNAIKEAVNKGKRKDITGLVQTALDDGADPQVLINEYMIDAMKEVGARFEAKKIFVPEMMMAARTMQTGLDVIKPLLEAQGSQKEVVGTVVIGTVFGDLHDIGKNLVVLMLESSGFAVHNIGENVPPETFVEKARELGADVVGLSSLLTTGDPHVKATVAAIKESDLAGKVKVVCGGAAVTPKFAVETCGADGHATDAVDAVKTIQKLMGLN
ncbi:MAG: cobalamin-dependent protein [Desulfarculaceae bacterium]|nr:cobalamin-dependent protein [Desulfarculaceae bacterium]MCF8073203.1 cobalamin-dependent protein [Desulfarculaceae bacterium]MCF8100799.1 cobalamin-dependent protein [Desulfarculaceae bacterium]MCF8118446.1 cobalamin-dependent protein [Desulfarculaceae bacterium]